ncbi:MAG TPA: flavodoxin-dependent (E)-4-hydroxy-3-methylbut-2-enyl-diphosphate synthase [Dehalococcoidia bacterium]|nr:flavodoxin-dependent (E)-4-hydroxy-3-methylbut-2-enyl-diphosphate synthase [Dehalococcoidia bacterium]
MTGQRRKSKQIRIGDVTVGGDAPVRVQSMCSTDTADVEATLRQIRDLVDLGCEIVRVAVPDREAAEALPELARRSPAPLVADIHFDHRLALAAIRAGVHGLRLNPGNIRDPEKVRQVVREAKAAGIPIRVGVNAGSLPPLPPLAEGELPPPLERRMVDAALWEIGILEDLGFDQIKVSLKAFDVPTMVAAYRDIATRVPYPLHLGVTEAGTPRAGSVRSAIGIGILLAEGIGDTIRVSLAADPREEVPVCWDILAALNLRRRGPTLVACPTCGRIEIDLIPLARKVEEHFVRRGKPLTVAVMGCVVNGPGEAKMADLGIAGGKGRGVIFRKGQVVRTVDEPDFLAALIEEGEKVIAELDAAGDGTPHLDDAVIPLQEAPR